MNRVESVNVDGTLERLYTDLVAGTEYRICVESFLVDPFCKNIRTCKY